jgi:hypothetical protein
MQVITHFGNMLVGGIFVIVDSNIAFKSTMIAFGFHWTSWLVVMNLEW